MTTHTRYAGFWTRTFADCMDSLLLDAASFFVGLMILGGFYWIAPGVIRGTSILDSMSSFSAQIILVVIRCGFAFVYFTWSTFWFGTTLGKRPLRIYVVSAHDLSPVSFRQSWIRCLSYCISYLPMGAGFLMVLFQPEKRALHDLIAGTVSVIRPKLTVNSENSTSENS